MTDDEKDRALCEAHCNSAADEYFNARPQLDSDANRRIFYAGHRKAWLERSEAVRLNAASVQPELVAVALAACDAVDDLIEKWYATRESGCLPNQVVRARGASKLLRAIALEY
jgi:hypothetical protein